jgi:tripartite-type tricarboxylate transporter receptor subunit TctC
VKTEGCSGAAAITLAAVCGLTAATHAQAGAAPGYPTKAVRLIVPFPPAGPTDYIARVLAQKLSEAWGQSVIVDNRSGAGGNIGSALVAKSSADGYTLLVTTTSMLVNQTLFSNPGYDAIKDFAAVTNAANSPILFFAHPGFPAKTMRDVVQLGASKAVNFASAGNGTTAHLAGEMLRTAYGVPLQHIPYKGAGPAINDVLGGQVQVGSTALPPPVPHVRSGALKALGVTSQKRSTALPDTATIAESGFPGYQVDNMVGVLVRTGTPQPIVTKVNAEIVRILGLTDVRERLADVGFEPIGNSPAEFAAYLRSESLKWAKVVRDSGAKVD